MTLRNCFLWELIRHGKPALPVVWFVIFRVLEKGFYVLIILKMV